MALTREQAEFVLVVRTKSLLAEAELSDSAGANPDLNDPLAWALMRLDIEPGNITAVADSDLASLAGDQVNAFLDLAELRLLQTVYQRLTRVDITVGPRSERYDQLAQRIQKAIEGRRKDIAVDHGIGLGTLDAGVISLDFMAKDTDGDYHTGG